MTIHSAKPFATAAVLALSLSACATARLPDKPAVASDPSGARVSLEQAVRALKPDEGQTLVFTLCEANAQTGRCLEPTVGLAGYGLGGIFLPLLMRVEGFELNRNSTKSEGAFRIAFSTTVNEIPPFCSETDAEFAILQGDILRLGTTPFFCNWVGIGNVVAQIEFAIDRVNAGSRSFTGRYALQLNGTGNAIGEGYFRADAAKYAPDS